MFSRFYDMAWLGVGICLLAACIAVAVLDSADEQYVCTDLNDRPISRNQVLGMAIDTFRLDTGRYPEVLSELNTKPTSQDADKWNGPYLKDEKDLLDSWGRPFRYEAPGHMNKTYYDLWSLGPDGLEGTDDGITNFDKPRMPIAQPGY